MTGPSIIGAQRFSDDDGSSDPKVRAALDAYSAGSVGQRRLLATLSGVRLLVPVVALAGAGEAPEASREDRADGHGDPGGDSAEQPGAKHSGAAVPIMSGTDGRRGVLGFTSTETLRRWSGDARPVPVTTAEACQAALEEGADALVIDVAGPVSFAVQGHFLNSLAEHGEVPEPKDDPQVLAAIYRITHNEFGIDRVRIMESDRADLGIRLELAKRDDESLRRVADRIAADLEPFLPGGVELSAVVRARREDDPPSGE